MSKTIPQRELRNQNAAVIEAVLAGESFIITRNGVPVAELRPLQQRRQQLVPKAELVAVAGGGPRIDPESFFTDLDALVDQSLG